MNTGAVITTVGTVLVAIFTLLGGWFVKRSDRAAKLTERYFDDAEFNMNLVGALRDDYWALFAWARSTNVKWHLLIEGLPRVCTGDRAEVQALMRDVGELPAIPLAMHRQLEQAHAAKHAPRDTKGDNDG